VAHKHGAWCDVAIDIMGYFLRVINVLRFDLFFYLNIKLVKTLSM
jgi:hypothetical protein